MAINFVNAFGSKDLCETESGNCKLVRGETGLDGEISSTYLTPTGTTVTAHTYSYKLGNYSGTCHPRESGNPTITRNSVDPRFRGDDKRAFAISMSDLVYDENWMNLYLSDISWFPVYYLNYAMGVPLGQKAVVDLRTASAQSDLLREIFLQGARLGTVQEILSAIEKK